MTTIISSPPFNRIDPSYPSTKVSILADAPMSKASLIDPFTLR